MNKINGYTDSFAPQTGWRQHGGMFSGVSVGDLILQSSGTVSISGCRNVSIQVLGGSGLLQYTPGPFEGWAARMSNQPSVAPNSDGTWPLAISGIFGLNDAYIGGQSIFANSTHGNVNFTADDRRYQFITGRVPPVRISGVAYVPIVGVAGLNNLGDLAMCFHSAILQKGSFSQPADTSEAAARALGPGVLTVNTGSGIINESVGSGLCFIQGTAELALPYLLDNWVRLPMSGMVISDLMFAPDGGSSGVFVMTPGLFRVAYHLSYRKTTGSTGRTIATRAIVRNRGSEAEQGTGLGGTGNPAVPGSMAYTLLVNTTAQIMSTASAEFLVNINAGQFLGFEVADEGGGALAQAAVMVPSGSYATIQYIGPQRSGF